ncbi:helix-turn-helix domain-containing protein [Streptomyces sp. NPDC004610]|uniref:MmyB family transcriptional regulator n=1 Tax=unclassified Streptomyces TaxID=2593676 RepID=UPI0033B02834
MGRQSITLRAQELGEFLRSRRAALDPVAQGFPDDGRRRRVPGLRREELAERAHISPDYLIRIEQGKMPRISRPVLESLADALQLAWDERAYLFALAYGSRPAERRPGRGGVEEVAPGLLRLLDGMRGVPALVLSRRTDVLAWTPMASALLTDFSALDPEERNLIRLTFLDEDFRALYADWARAARNCVGLLRLETGLSPENHAIRALVGELSTRDPDFQRWWTGHQVWGPRELTKTYLHPLVGEVTVDVQQFEVETHPGQQLVAYTAAPGTPAEEQLGFLTRWITGRDDPHRDAQHRDVQHPDTQHPDTVHPGRPHPDRPHPGRPYADSPYAERLAAKGHRS